MECVSMASQGGWWVEEEGFAREECNMFVLYPGQPNSQLRYPYSYIYHRSLQTLMCKYMYMAMHGSP